MAEHEEWTAGDDARLRAALGSLRADVEGLPLADPRFVRARGARRRRQRMVSWTAAAAAAVVVAGAVGYGQLGRDTTLPTPPARTPVSTTTSSPTTTDPLDSPGLLPLPAEWQQSLDLPAGSVTVEPVTKGGDVECGAVVGDLDRQESVRVQGSTMTGGASHWAVEGSLARAVADLRQAVASCVVAPDFAVQARRSTDDWALYSYTTPDAGSGWFVVVGAQDDAVLLQLVEPDEPTSAVPEAAVAALATTAYARLERYGADSTASPTAPGPATTATDEKMPVSGPDPKPSSTLFVAASQWTSPSFGKGAKAYAGEGAMEGSTTVITCETDAQQAGVGGRVGVVSIRAGAGEANYVGKQRVRVFDDVRGYELAQADLQRIDQLVMKGCRSAGGARTTAERGPVQGTYLLTTQVTTEATGTMYQWVGVTGMQTEGGASTIVFHGTDDGQGFQGSKAQGFEELLRLMDLARQK